MTQREMFDPEPDPLPAVAPGDDPEIDTDAGDGEAALPRAEPLAAPCGFRNTRNEPCRRLASKPLCIDGVQLVSRGIPILLCNRACFRDQPSDSDPLEEQEATSDTDTDRDMETDRDPNDPGYDEGWNSGQWERDEGF